MGKEVAYIAGFSKGSYGNAAANGVPENYAVYTENVDPRFSDRVFPTRQSTAIAGSPSAAGLDAEVLKATNFDGVALWGWEAAGRKLQYYNPATTALVTPSGLTTPSGNTLASMSNINREFYLPMFDNTTKEATDAYWAGLIAHGQFGASAPSSYVLEKAKCEPYYYIAGSNPISCYFNYVTATPANSRVSNSTTTDVFTAITPPAVGDFTNPVEDGFFVKERTYYWAVSLVYDGYQESPLSKSALVTDSLFSWQVYFASNGVDRSQNYSGVNLKIYINTGSGATAISKRITGVNLYRAETLGSSDVVFLNLTTPPASKYRLVKSFSIRTGALSPEVVQSGGSATSQSYIPFLIGLSGSHNYTQNSGTVYRIDFTDTGIEGATYEENTGVYDTLEQNWINYRLSCFANGYHFVGRCAGAPTLLSGNSRNFIFRSAPNAPAVFNIAKDFLQLPDSPTALVAWNGRLYAFSETRFMRINPEAMFVEEEIIGFGAIGDSTTLTQIGNSRLVCVTPYGIFFADLNNIYKYDGQRIESVGDRVIRNIYAPNLSWIGTNETRRRQSTMVFDPYSQRVLIFFKSHDAADTQQYYLSYDPINDRWDYGKPSGSPWTAGSVKAADFDSTGKLYASLSSTDWGAADVLHSMFTGNDEAMTLVTPAYDFGSLKQTKWFYDVVTKNSGLTNTTADIDYRLEEGGTSWTTSATVTASGILSSIDLNKVLGRVLQLRVTMASSGAVGGNTIDDITIQFRRKLMRE